MAKKPKRYFKIRCKVTGLYSKGTSYISALYSSTSPDKSFIRPGFTENGKIWAGTGPLRNHLNLVIKSKGFNIDDLEIVECELIEKPPVPISDYCNIMKILKG
jgi:hypothetical protein